jgi:hypothetical protein
MRTLLLVFAGLLVYSFDALCQVIHYGIPVKDEVPAYLNATRKVFEQPLFFIGKNDRVVVQAREKNMVRIETASKQTGWVESPAIKIVSRNQSIAFENAEVPGYINNPDPTIIIGPEDAIERSLALNRSFADELRENVDRETIARQSGE